VHSGARSVDEIPQVPVRFDEKWEEMLAWWEEVSYGVTSWSTAPRSEQMKGRAMLFVDHFEHSLDAKHRLVLPSSFRKILGDRVYLAPQDNSLAVYSKDGFQEVTNRLLDRSRAGDTDARLRLAFASKTVEINVDSAGRITIPQRLREYANLTDDVVVAGAITHVEIWDRAAYLDIQERLDDVVNEQFRTGVIIN